MPSTADMSPTDAAGTTRLTDARALNALANPFRARMMDALTVDGPSTASALARRTGQAVGSASHHLKVLHEAGLVEEAPELAKDRRERWWRRVSPGVWWSRGQFADDSVATTAALAAESIGLEREHERARAWLANSETAGAWLDASFATHLWLTLSVEELATLADEFIAFTTKWRDRAVPDDGVEREPVYVFARGFPDQP